MNTANIGKKIVTLRKEHGYTQEKLAELLHVSPQAVSKWETGHALPETGQLATLARTLDTSIDQILADSTIQILSAYYGDGLEHCNVASRLNKLIQNDVLDIEVHPATLAYQMHNIRPKFLIVKYQIEDATYYTMAEEGQRLLICPDTKGYQSGEGVEIIAASYGTASAKYDVMQKIEHYKVFNWNEYHADHETFPSDPTNDEPDFLTFVYLNQEGIHFITCEEGESIAYNEDRTDLYRRQMSNESFIAHVPMIPEFGQGMECSWGAALTVALQAMGIKTSYEHVMGVSGACYRLAFCSPGWDYSSVDGLVAYDYATSAYKAFGFIPRFVNRIDKENRAEERTAIVNDIRCNMPVIGINLRVAPEWGVICGYKENGTDLFCRTKYDAEILRSSDFEHGKDNAYDYLYVDNWPFLITHFTGQTIPPADKENLIQSLKVFMGCAEQKNCRGYAMGLHAYDVWIRDLLDEEWYRINDDEQFARRFSVNQFCVLSLYDARRAAYQYLTDSMHLIAERDKEMKEITRLFGQITDAAREIHAMLDSKESLDGTKARIFFTMEMRERQANLLEKMRNAEYEALGIAKLIVMS